MCALRAQSWAAPARGEQEGITFQAVVYGGGGVCASPYASPLLGCMQLGELLRVRDHVSVVDGVQIWDGLVCCPLCACAQGTRDKTVLSRQKTPTWASFAM